MSALERELAEQFSALRIALSRATALQADMARDHDEVIKYGLKLKFDDAVKDVIEAYSKLELSGGVPILSVIETSLHGDCDDLEN